MVDQGFSTEAELIAEELAEAGRMEMLAVTLLEEKTTI
jgi:hypothetical protein